MGHNELLISELSGGELEQAMPAQVAVGDRYPEAQMGQLDSER